MFRDQTRCFGDILRHIWGISGRYHEVLYASPHLDMDTIQSTAHPLIASMSKHCSRAFSFGSCLLTCTTCLVVLSRTLKHPFGWDLYPSLIAANHMEHQLQWFILCNCIRRLYWFARPFISPITYIEVQPKSKSRLAEIDRIRFGGILLLCSARFPTAATIL